MLIDIELVFISACFIFFFSKKNKTACPISVDATESGSLISKETSSFFKALCCVVIVLHHFALRCENGWLVTRFFAIGGGSFSLPIFFILSSYGITKSELKNGTNLTSFIKKRFLKILIPFWIINFITVLTYGLISPKDLLLEELAVHRINPNFVLAGSASIVEKVKMCIGLVEIDGAMWFVYVILISYAAFFISKSIFSIKKTPKKFLSLYTLIIILSGVCFYVLDFPAHYWRNLWSLVLGCVLVSYDLTQNKKNYLLILIMANCYFLIYMAFTHDIFYVFFANVALILLLVANIMFKKGVKYNKAIVALSASSYWVYLIHIKVLTLEWFVWGYNDVILPLIAIIAISIFFSKTIKIGK